MAVYRNTVSAWATWLLSTGDHVLRAPSGVHVLQVADFTTAQKIKENKRSKVIIYILNYRNEN